MDDRALQPLLESILASGQVQIQTIEAEARATTEALLDEAQVVAQQYKTEAFRRAERQASQDHLRLMHEAELNAIRLVGEAREEMVANVLQQGRERLMKIRSHPCYPVVLSHLLHEALTVLQQSLIEGETCILEADPRDQHLIEAIIGDNNLAIEVNYSLTCWGGVIAHWNDHCIEAINTLESRFERAMPHLRREVATILTNESE